jgi:hypothetical protein
MPPTQSDRRPSTFRNSEGGAGKAATAGWLSLLTKLLATRFEQPLEQPELPLVVINRIPQTKSAHVLVIWDQWKNLSIPQRSQVIADAFALAFPREDMVVRVPMGLTSGEAFSQGYLRYQISPLVRPSDHVSAKQVKDAMVAAGGVLLQVGGDQQLRFATRAQAEEAYRRLVEKINKPIWALSEETSAPYGGE